ncbi:MAG: hypothetical protein NW207_07440 [Cytophagales bacterium]|nr:hypothetical protein [Cytophagales bacterium]
MKSSITITTSLSQKSVDFLKKYAKENNTPKNKVIEEAIELLRIEMKKKKWAEDYQRMNLDKEYLNEMNKIAEWAVNDGLKES